MTTSITPCAPTSSAHIPATSLRERMVEDMKLHRLSQATQRNYVRDVAKKEWLPLGFNRFEKTTYANREVLLNAVEYLIDPTGVIEARTKEVKLRDLDAVRVKKDKLFWQVLNLALPILLVAIFGFLFFWLRRKKYAES